jgi:hypothetical protein
LKSVANGAASSRGKRMPKKGKKGKKGMKDPASKEPFVPPWHKGKPLWYTRGFITDGGTSQAGR